jgi:hypothetical protein
MEVKMQAKLVDPEAKIKIMLDEQSGIKEANFLLTQELRFKSEDLSQEAEEQVKKLQSLAFDQRDETERLLFGLTILPKRMFIGSSMTSVTTDKSKHDGIQ